MDTSIFVPKPEDVAPALVGASVADVVLLAQQCLRSGAAHTALVLCRAAGGIGLSDPALELTHAMASFATGDRQGALSRVDALLAGLPGHLAARHLRAHMAAALGDKPAARDLLLGVAETWPDFPGAQGALASLVFPGPYYRDVLASLHRRLRPDTYLEIGVETGATLALATTASIAVGVDPVTRLVDRPLPRTAKLHALESDAFFAQESRDTVFGGRPVDLAFIDGMHWFEYGLRDFANAERWSAPGSTIVIHDCLPVTPAAARRERASNFWVGDTWKVLECLLDHRPDLSIAIVPTPPSGLVLVRRLDPTSRVLHERMEEVVVQYRDLPYPHVAGAWPSRYPIVENTEQGLASALGDA